MASDPVKTPFALLPDRRPPWGEFVFSSVTQAGLIALLLWIHALRPQILTPVRDYHEMVLVTTPPPVNHQPAPIREFRVPDPVAHLDTTIPGGKYATTRFEGKVEDIGGAWATLLRDWLPSSGMQLDARPFFEYYSPQMKYNPQTGVFECDLCIPVAAL